MPATAAHPWPANQHSWVVTALTSSATFAAYACCLPHALQEPELALQALSHALLALSMSYDCVFFIFELGDSLLQPILHNSTNLQGLARAAGVKLQLLTCFSAANTQVSQ
jgi:hypothetical protein